MIMPGHSCNKSFAQKHLKMKQYTDKQQNWKKAISTFRHSVQALQYNGYPQASKLNTKKDIWEQVS